MTVEFQKLTAEDLSVGQRLIWPIYDSNGAMLVKQGFVIKLEQQIDRLVLRGAFAKKTDLAKAKQTPPPPAEEKFKDFSPFKVLEQVSSQLAISLASADTSEFFTDEIFALVDDIQRACHRDSHAALASLFVLEANSYPIKHSVDVAVLTELIAKQRGYSIEDRQSSIAAALTMNIAMIELQEKMFRQDQPPTEQQQQVIQEHSRQGVVMLKRAKVTDDLWLKSVLTHHEKVSGDGYPHKLRGEQYPEASQIISLADIYCAQLSPRAYRDPLLHKDILRDILLDKGETVSVEIAGLYIKELGFYPPGMIVQLANAEVGVVTKKGETPDSPIVHACMRPQVGNFNAPILRNTKMPAFTIRRVLQSDDPDVTFERRTVWGFDES
jgi:HD-GYP domain-containing protein (c-di-GMP phosphodiesterase class II)